MSQKLSPIERDILSKLEVVQLQFLRKIAADKNFQTFVDITAILVDYEKNFVFKLDESDPSMPVKKANSRGRAGGYTQFARIIMASGEEIERREEEIENKKGDK